MSCPWQVNDKGDGRDLLVLILRVVVVVNGHHKLPKIIPMPQELQMGAIQRGERQRAHTVRAAASDDYAAVSNFAELGALCVSICARRRLTDGGGVK